MPLAAATTLPGVPVMLANVLKAEYEATLAPFVGMLVDWVHDEDAGMGCALGVARSPC